MLRSLHHSNLLVGSRAEAELYLQSVCNDLGIKIANNPDFVAFRIETFGISDARQLSLLSQRKALNGKKIFLIAPESITLEAQNALLKTFEDPSPNSHFFLVIKEEALIIPTLRSRMEVVTLSKSSVPDSNEAEKFLNMNLKSRLAFVKKFVDAEESLPAFLDDLLLLLRKEKKESALVEKVYNVRRFAHDPSVLPRLIIEHLALML